MSGGALAREAQSTLDSQQWRNVRSSRSRFIDNAPNCTGWQAAVDRHRSGCLSCLNDRHPPRWITISCYASRNATGIF